MALVAIGAVLSGERVTHAREDIMPGSRLISARSAGLADQFIGIVDDSTALFYNPAGLARIRRFQTETTMQFGVNSSFINTMTTNSYKFYSLPLYKDVLANNIGTSPGVSGVVFPTVSFRGFSGGLLFQTRVTGKDRGDGTIRNRSKYELIPTAGISLPLYSGLIRVGYSAQYLNVAEGNVILNKTDTLGYNVGLPKGTALAHTAGASLTIPMAYLPSAHFVARNILGTKFKSTTLYSFGSTSTETPPDEPMTFDAALAISPKAGNGVTVNYTIELRDVTNTKAYSIYTMRLGTAAEINIRNSVFLRGGWGSGSPSVGLGFRSGRTDLNLGWWAEEIGDKPKEERDTRFTVQYTMRAF